MSAETGIAKTEKKEISIVEKQLQSQETTLIQSVAMKALDLVKPMISSVSDELTNSLGDNEKLYLIKVNKLGAPATIYILDTQEDFTIHGAKANRDSANILKDQFIKKMLDEGRLSKEDYEKMKQSDNKFVFRGEIDKETKRPKAIKKFYVIREFVDMLLTGRMTEMTEKLMK